MTGHGKKRKTHTKKRNKIVMMMIHFGLPHFIDWESSFCRKEQQQHRRIWVHLRSQRPAALSQLLSASEKTSNLVSRIAGGSNHLPGRTAVNRSNTSGEGGLVMVATSLAAPSSRAHSAEPFSNVRELPSPPSCISSSSHFVTLSLPLSYYLPAKLIFHL